MNIRAKNILEKIIALLFLFMILTSCSSNSSLYNSDFPFSNELAYSPDSTFSVAIPSGWYQVEDNECRCGNILLVRNDYQTSLNLIPVRPDDFSMGRIQKDPLSKLLKYSKIWMKQKLGENMKIVEKESFRIGEITVRSFTYLNGNNIKQRILVFQIKDRFFELTANCATTDEDIQYDLFSAQNSLLAKISVN